MSKRTSIDLTEIRAKLNGALLGLTATEFRLLEFMMSRQGIVFSRDQLLNAVWGQDRAITDRAVDVPKTHCDVSDVIWAAALILSGGLIFALPGA